MRTTLKQFLDGVPLVLPANQFCAEGSVTYEVLTEREGGKRMVIRNEGNIVSAPEFTVEEAVDYYLYWARDRESEEAK